MHRQTLFCGAPAGIAGSASVDFLGVPDMGECLMLIVAVGLFSAAVYAAFKVWRKPADPRHTDIDGALAIQMS